MTSDGTCRERQLRARLRRRRRLPTADPLGQPIAEKEIGDEILAARREEAAFLQPRLDVLEGSDRRP
jgi:hypothetical protein